MPLILYLIRLKAPLLIRARAHKVGFEPLRNRIPATTIGGALASRRLFSYSDVVSGRVFISDAYPIAGDTHPTMPALPICAKIKEGIGPEELGNRVICSLNALKSHNPGKSFLEDLDKLSDKLHIDLHVAVKPARSEILYECNRLKEYPGMTACKRFTIKGVWRDSVAINVSMKRGEEGMLYSYEAIDHKLWWGVAYLDEDIASRIGRESLELLIGGGRGRGFGRATFKFTFISEKDYYTKLSQETAHWYMLWSPLPLTRVSPVKHAIPSGKILLESWSSSGPPRPSIPSLAPGSLVETDVDPLKARFQGLLPPHGSAEPLTMEGLPVTLQIARGALSELLTD